MPYLIDNGEVIGHILRVESRERLREPDGERWCFRCRKRRVFEYVVTVPVDPESWYGPGRRIECGSCGLDDGDLFPGRVREWEEDGSWSVVGVF